MIDNKTTNLKLPLPDLGNYTAEDIPRLIQALKLIDELLATKTDMNAKADATETASAINLKANTEDVISALAAKALTGGSTSNAFLVGAATDANHAVRLLQMQQRVGSAGAPSGRNKIVDGRFDFWYEGVSQSSSEYGSDTMWRNEFSGSSRSHSLQNFNLNSDLPAIEVPSARNYSRTVVTSASNGYCNKSQRVESVLTLAGKQAVISFYARADAPKNIAFELFQNFGFGGGASTEVIGIGQQLVALTSAWARYALPITIPSVAGKTIGPSNTDHLGVLFWFDAYSALDGRTAHLGSQSGTFDLFGIQLEEGSVATPFEELPPEVAQLRLNRQYVPYGMTYTLNNGPTASNFIAGSWPLPVTMRAMPTFTFKDQAGNEARVSSSNNGHAVYVGAGAISADYTNIYADALLNVNCNNWIKFYAKCDARL